MRKLFDKTITRLVILLLCCSILPILALGTIVNRLTSSMLDTHVIKMYQQTIQKTSLSIANNIQPFIDYLRYNSEREEVVDILAKPQRTTQQQTQTNADLKLVMKNKETAVRVGYPYSYLAINNQYIRYTEYASITKLDSTISEEEWFQSLRTTHFPRIWIGVGKNATSIGINDRVYIAAPVLKNSNNVGVLMYAINISFLEKQLDNAAYGEHCSIFVLDDSGECVAAGQKNDIDYALVRDELQHLSQSARRLTIDGEDYMVAMSYANLSYTQTDWRIVAITPTSDIYQDAIKIKFAALSLTLLLMLVDVFVLMYVSDNYFAPIIVLHKSMREVRHGNLGVRIEETRTDEIGELQEGFNAMVISLERNIANVHEQERKKRELELKVLQQQIRPHFVSNTLNTIRVMADMRSATGISKAVTAFNSLIDYYFRDTADMPTVREEIQALRQYVYLQNLRFQNRFSLEEDIDQRIYACRIPKLLLQSLVENCIKHGFPDRRMQGCIRLSGRIEEKRVIIQVIDNGVGMCGKDLTQIFSEEELTRERVGEHQGLSNVHRRIRLHFGPDFGLSAAGTPGHGTTVTVTFPYIVFGKEEGNEGSDRG